MNPFLYALRQPVHAFADLAVVMAFLAALVVVVWALSSNVMELYVQWDTGGWDVSPPLEWVFRLALVPAAVAVASWLVSAMFAMLG